MEILKIENLTIRNKKNNTFLLKDVSFTLTQGEILGILGESGSGKSLTSLAILGLLPSGLEIVKGAIYFQGRNLLELSSEEWESIRGWKISIILQDPLTSLNPLLTIGEQIVEGLEVHLGLKGRSAWDKAVELLSEVGIPEPEFRMKSYPHQLSGGMRQRAMIAIALACNPMVLIADEPTTALDPTLQLQVLDLLKELNKKRGLSIIFITHDLGVMRYIADRVVVYYKGEVVEIGESEKIFTEPSHPYTLSLLFSYPRGPKVYSYAT